MLKLPYLEYMPTTSADNALKGGRVPLVYFFVCENGMVIYVGRTDRFLTRWKQHMMSDKAMHLVHRVELHIMDSDAEAHFYETEMILKYAPLWNSIGRRAKPSKYSVMPVSVVHYRSTACARYVLPYARFGHACYTLKHKDTGNKTLIDVSRKGEHVGKITVQNDLSEIVSDAGVSDHYYNKLVERMEYCAEHGKEAYRILYEEYGFADMIVPDAITKCYWDGAIHRERIQDWEDDSEYYDTGIIHELPSVECYLKELEYVPAVCVWYNPPGYA